MSKEKNEKMKEEKTYREFDTRLHLKWSSSSWVLMLVAGWPIVEGPKWVGELFGVDVHHRWYLVASKHLAYS
jgi:hypothetical protein